MVKLNAKTLRASNPTVLDKEKVNRNQIYIVCENVLDTYNIGSIFRLADATAVKRVYLTDDTLTPPNSRIKKASINTWQWVDWKYKKNVEEAIAEIKLESPEVQVVAVEQHPKSHLFQTITFRLPLAIIVGNETYGVTSGTLDQVDEIAEIPMWGVNKSLNVMVSTGIILYEIMKQTKISQMI
jgi:23S rRNA (guanosine2251-2'-O)-methyltransferase